ncbi:uncharacterized protein LOC142530687 [Primulina tabacum]|uniref:uncharacterized protein LOC142530687 n=1 Tax=Primulina tabacum TaxID=48773 RepID=UPI003F597438
MFSNCAWTSLPGGRSPVSGAAAESSGPYNNCPNFVQFNDEVKKNSSESSRKKYKTFSVQERRQYVDKVLENRKKRKAVDFHPTTSQKAHKQKCDGLLKALQSVDGSTHDSTMLQPHELHPMHICCYCGAKKFQFEPPTFCCDNGKIKLAATEVPPDMLNLFTDYESTEAMQFRKNVRAYNSIFSFTSLGVKIDKELASSSRGVYTFRALGQIFHNLLSLVPNEGGPSHFQLYFWDIDNELHNRMNIMDNTQINEDTMKALMKVMGNNPYAELPRRINGENGWHQNIPKYTTGSSICGNKQTSTGETTFSSIEDMLNQEQQGISKESNKLVSCREYYCYKLQMRDHLTSVLLYAGRLFQQYIVDMYIKLETTRLDYYQRNQAEMRAEFYQGIVDSIIRGETRGSEVGQRIVLPASFIGGPRDMRRRYLNAMALVRIFGKPDLFITMTCNPEWKEIKDNLKEGQKAQDRPDLTSRLVKYLYKYIYKGHDKVAVHIAHEDGENVIDEIKNFQDARWVSAQEAVWRIFEFDLNEISQANIMCGIKRTSFGNKGKKGKVIGRVNGANSVEGERYYLRLLLNHVRGPTSFDNLLTVDGNICFTFKEAAQRRDVRKLWETYFEAMSEDFKKNFSICRGLLTAKTLQSLSMLLESMGKDIGLYDLPKVTTPIDGPSEVIPREILDELAVNIPDEDYLAQSNLNTAQRKAFSTIIDCLDAHKNGLFFVDGPGGTGKTYLYRALLANVRSRKMIALATSNFRSCSIYIAGWSDSPFTI